ncbi:MAG: hypothetical protein LBL47_01280 [Lactobacillus sp.]|jgi:hypothetical protein|nr:hypothetical protein [Lactobacillus sp.]
MKQETDYLDFGKISIFGCYEYLKLGGSIQFVQGPAVAEYFKAIQQLGFTLSVREDLVSKREILPEDIENASPLELWESDNFCLKRLKGYKMKKSDKDVQFRYDQWASIAEGLLIKVLTGMLHYMSIDEMEYDPHMMKLAKKRPMLLLNRNNMRYMLHFLKSRKDLTGDDLTEIFLKKEVIDTIFKQKGAWNFVNQVVDNNREAFKREGPQRRVKELMEDYPSWKKYLKYRL